MRGRNSLNASDHEAFNTSKPEARFTVEAGRQIYRDGKPFVSIHREGLGGPPSPVEADELTHVVCALLNKLGNRTIVTTYLQCPACGFYHEATSTFETRGPRKE